MAQKMLESNVNNRKLAENIVAQYTRDMSNDQWKLNGETIKISKSGVLLDGQHRLHACIRSNKDFDVMLVEGLDDEVFDTIDTGKKRTAGQIISIAGYEHANLLASSIRLINLYERKALKPTKGGHAKNLTASEIVDWINAHTFIIEAAKEGKRLEKICNGSAATAAYYLMYLKNYVTTCKYFTDIHSGENLSAGDPALAVRNRMFAKGKNFNSFEQLVVLIRGWNAIRNHQKLSIAKGFIKNVDGEYNQPEIE